MSSFSSVFAAGGMVNGGPRFVAIPNDDDEFARDVAHAASAAMSDGLAPHEALAELVQRLIASYPRVLIRERSGLASFESEPDTWYVYRDGRGMERDSA